MRRKHGGDGSGRMSRPPRRDSPRRVLLALLMLAGCGGRNEAGSDAGPPPGAPPPTCGVDDRTVLTGTGIGALQVGATVADVRSQCMILSDSMVPGPEGQLERRLVVVTGPVNTAATIVDERVWRLAVASPRFRTADSLGVGRTVADLRTPQARLARGEGNFVLRGDHCGLSFQLGAGVPPEAQTLDAVPDSVRVERVLVTGCSRSGQP